MSAKSFKFILIISIVILLSSCVVSHPKFFAETGATDDLSYGYTPENPIAIKNADLRNSISASYYYLSRLRTKKGNELAIVERHSVDNPNYKKSGINLQNRHTGKSLSYGKGPILDYYILLSENESDTIKLYINPYLKGEVKIPVGLKFAKE